MFLILPIHTDVEIHACMWSWGKTGGSLDGIHRMVSKIFIGQGHYGKVKGQIKVTHHDVAHLHPLTNVITKYQLPTPTETPVTMERSN